MADRPTVDYIGECIVKCAQVVLGSRIYQPGHARPAPDKRSGRWFLLEVEEVAGLSARLDPWRRDVYAPLVIEVSIQPWGSSAIVPGSAGAAGAGGSGGHSAGPRTLLERWTVAFCPGPAPGGGSAAGRAVADTAAIYKRLILLVRSLYSYVRVLPAYRLYRASKRHGRDLFNTTYSLSTAPPPPPQQQQQQQGGRMCRFHFSPVETVSGHFAVSAEYQPATAVHFLEQTTAVLPCAPRVIPDYVDGPVARSAPQAEDRPQRQAPAGGVEAGGVGLLRGPQAATPLVRTSWSSRNVAAPPVIQRGFNPPARSHSLGSSGGAAAAAAAAATAAASSGAASGAAAHPQLLHLHRRSLSQGFGSPSPCGTPAAAVASSSIGSGGQLLAGSNSPVAFHGPASLGRPPLPHSPALTSHSAAAQGGLSQPAALGASCSGGGNGGPVLPISPGTPLSGSRGLERAAEGTFGSAPSQPAQVLGFARHAHAHARPPPPPADPQLRQQGFHIKAPQQRQQDLQDSQQTHPPEGGTAGSGGASEAPAVGRAPAGGQLRQQGHLHPGERQLQGPGAEVSPVVASGNESGTILPPFTPADGSGLAAAPDALGDASCPSSAARDAAPGAAADGAAARAVSAPVSIPSRGKGRARSVADLAAMASESGGGGGGGGQDPYADAFGRQPASTSEAHLAAAAPQPGVAGAGRATGRAGASGGLASTQQRSGSSGLLRVHCLQQQQQTQQAAASAPAAPRGMLGQLLSGAPSPSFSPPASGGRGVLPPPAACILAASASAVASGGGGGGAGGEEAVGSAAADGGPVGSGAGATLQSRAIIIAPKAPQHSHGVSGASPSSSGSGGRATHHPRPPGGFAQAGAAGGSVLSSSPQLPFAFTPSAASLGQSLMSLADQHRTMLAGGAGLAAGRVLAAPAAGRTAGTGGGAAALPSPLGAGAGSSACGTAGAGSMGLGTPSPPPHVSCVRDISGLATIRRPSWSSRSSSFDVAASASLPHHLSVSPLIGDILDPGLLGCSGSNSSAHGGVLSMGLGGGAAAAGGGARTAGGGGGSGGHRGRPWERVMTPAVVLPGGFGPSGDGSAVGEGGLAATSSAGHGAEAAKAAAEGARGYGSAAGGDAAPGGAAAGGAPSGSEAQEAPAPAAGGAVEELLLASAMPDESESDLLPFAIDADAGMASQLAPAAAAAGCGGAAAPHAPPPAGGHFSAAPALGGGSAAAAAPAERDVAVGAFVQAVKDAAAAQLTHAPQPLLVCDAMQQVQQLATELHRLLVFPGGADEP